MSSTKFLKRKKKTPFEIQFERKLPFETFQIWVASIMLLFHMIKGVSLTINKKFKIYIL